MVKLEFLGSFERPRIDSFRSRVRSNEKESLYKSQNTFAIVSSDRELAKRLNEAKECLKNRQGLFANPAKAVGELSDLDIGDTNNVWQLISELLGEISPKDYKGTRPPQKSYEKTITGLELLAFSWWSPKVAKQMYIKFVLKNERYYYVSLHQSRSTEQKGEDQ